MLCSGCRGKFRRKKLIDLNNAGIVLGANGLPIIQLQLQLKNEFETEDIVMTEEDSILNSDIPCGENVPENNSSNCLLAEDVDIVEVGTAIQNLKGIFHPDRNTLSFASDNVVDKFHCAVSSLDQDDDMINQYCNQKKRKMVDPIDSKVKTRYDLVIQEMEETTISRDKRLGIVGEVDTDEVEVEVEVVVEVKVTSNITPILDISVHNNDSGASYTASCAPTHNTTPTHNTNDNGIPNQGYSVPIQHIGVESVHNCSFVAPSKCQTEILTNLSSSSSCIRHSHTEGRIDVKEICDTEISVDLSYQSNSVKYCDDEQNYEYHKLSFELGKHGYHHNIASSLHTDSNDHITGEFVNAAGDGSNDDIKNRNRHYDNNTIHYDNSRSSSSSTRGTYNFDKTIHENGIDKVIDTIDNDNNSIITGENFVGTDGNTDSCSNTDGNMDSCSNTDGNMDSCSNTDGNTDSCSNTDGNTDSCSNTDGNTDSCSNTDDELVVPQTYYKHSESRSHVRITSPSTSATAIEMKINVSCL